MTKKNIMARIKISDSFAKQLDLGEKIFSYHKSLGDKSPLKSHFEMKDFDKFNGEAKKT